ncbi:hypothetical protein RRG08_039492 [Elysia crispata]|uniref:Uncharacterized protein n=1 Tax=Elysia crispata TaxID=231223 RepID=A0AAE0YJN5_9GAST|nr:hypothetical protein RRG08_039492 [Elysia crispata]
MTFEAAGSPWLTLAHPGSAWLSPKPEEARSVNRGRNSVARSDQFGKCSISEETSSSELASDSSSVMLTDDWSSDDQRMTRGYS